MEDDNMMNNINEIGLVSVNKNRSVIAESDDKKVWAGVVKKKETDEVQVVVWTEKQGVKSKSKRIDKADIINGGKALEKTLDNYDIMFQTKDANGQTVSCRKLIVTNALKKAKELINKAENLADPNMGMNLTEIHRHIVESIDKMQGNDGFYTNVQNNPNLVGCSRKRLKEILDAVSDESDWTIKEVCSELSYQDAMVTDPDRYQHAINDSIRGYVFKR